VSALDFSSPPRDATLPRERLPVRGLVGPKVIAEYLGVTEEHVRRRWRSYPFAVRLSARLIRFDPVAFDQYLDALSRRQG
jgi:hypothetical protein